MQQRVCAERAGKCMFHCGGVTKLVQLHHKISNLALGPQHLGAHVVVCQDVVDVTQHTWFIVVDIGDAVVLLDRGHRNVD